jgi:hypothetical protein
MQKCQFGVIIPIIRRLLDRFARGIEYPVGVSPGVEAAVAPALAPNLFLAVPTFSLIFSPVLEVVGACKVEIVNLK